MPARRSLPLMLLALPAATAEPPPARLLSQAEAAYQPRPKGIAMCAACTLFVRPDLCRVVEGPVAPEGWCRLFDMVD